MSEHGDGPILLATATQREMEAVLARLSPADAALAPAPGGAMAARLGPAARAALLLVTGVGPVAAAATCSAHLARTPNVAGVLNLGLAGVYADHIPLGAPLVAEAEVYPEYGLLGAEGPTAGPGTDGSGSGTGTASDAAALADGRALGFAQLPGPEGPIVQRLALYPDKAARAMELTLPPDAARGAFASVAGVSAAPWRAALLAARHGLLAENMEGFSLALVATVHNVPFLEVRAASNRAGSRRAEDWDLERAFDTLSKLAQTLFSRDG